MADPPTIEQRLANLEQALAGHAAQIGQLAAGVSPKISTKLAGILTTVVSILTYVAGSGLGLPTPVTLGITALTTGIAAFEAAENT